MAKAKDKDEEDKSKKGREEESKRREALERAVEQIEKQFGKGAIMSMGAQPQLGAPGIPTGALSLDLALGGNGVPRGRVVEIYGPDGSGKTTLALEILASSQRRGGIAAFIDAENALDPSWARTIGVNMDNLLVSQPDSGEQALEIVELLVRSNAVDVIVVDSVAALVPRAEIEGEMGVSLPGLQARLMSQALRKLSSAIRRSQTCVIFTNQIRERIGIMFGNPEFTPGGRALKFYASIRIDIRRVGSIKEGDVIKGSRTRTRVVKNKLAPPFKTAEFDIMYDEGISYAGDVLDLGVESEVVNKSGSWYSFGDVRLGQGRESAKQFLNENPDLLTEIRTDVLQKHGIVTSEPEKEEKDSQPDVSQ